MDHPMGLRSASGKEERVGGGRTGGHWKTEPVRLTAALPAREIRQPIDSTLTGFEIAAGTGSAGICAPQQRAMGPGGESSCSIIGCEIHWLDAEVAMKRYLIFGAIGPLIGGFLMLFATTVASGYWSDTNWSEIGKFLGAFFRTLQYSYLFAIVPMLMLGAIDDILYHVKRITPVVRMLILGAVGFATASLLYGSRGPDAGALQFVLYGIVGLVPAMLSSWLAHRYDAPQAVHST
jgi:hypothetical protein